MRSHVIFNVGPKDTPFSDPPPDTVLWRYLEAYKFLSLIEHRKLWFSSIRCFNDHFEGFRGEDNPDSPGEIQFKKDYNVTSFARPTEKELEIKKAVHFAYCWHMNKQEDLKMWSNYSGEGTDAIAMVATLKSLRRGFKKSDSKLIYSPVVYTNNDTPRPAVDHHSQFFYKDSKKYRFEREYRIICCLQDDESVAFNLSDGQRKLVDFNFNSGIQRLVFHPEATASFRKEAESKFRSLFGSVRHIENSIYQRSRKRR